ncbi:MAG: GTP 3',8-cyclase MoaA [Actinobacteria bacterium]|nr:GTP 3',8-cyclase MoaA [Actinomycetota bacterium]MBL7123815.1 GTP 3',8-cyclase MoaA [Actinomycetota bacterium]
MEEKLIDNYNRKIDYLRLSVTDRCNLRCTYCMPERGIKLLDRRELLTFEEILRAVRILSELGIKKIRLTGGEPLLRDNILGLIEGIRNIPGIEDISLTTNGTLLRKFLKDLYSAGIKRINVSMDSLDPEKYRMITRGGDLTKVLEAIESSVEMGFESVKINVVLTNLFDQKDSLEFIKFAIEKPVSIRFIEMMSISGLDTVECSSNLINIDKPKVDIRSIFESMNKFGKYCKIKEPMGFGPAVYYRINGSKGKIGFIINKRESCYYCNRIRLTSKGSIKLCLFSSSEIDIKEELRDGANNERIKKLIKSFIKRKPKDRNSNIKCKVGSDLKIASFMNKIGG